ncbi:MAG TPA: Gfo/Idh/MocA family oxidoreductase [Acidimicrobiales bacterium]|nr:Gfo/Idh/MocA family oxidoreductase [Acidimicrobiales bacterium]
MDPVRIGCLGAARITNNALVKPARATPGAVVTAIAARDEGRARAYADKHRIATAYGSYAALLADPAVDAVYNPLPNGLHGTWTVRALEAGKHVLCEKPFTANAEEAELVAAAAGRTGLVVMEAFHWRYHPLAARMLEVVASGELGEVRRVEAMVCFPNLKRDDIRWDLGLAGGALMDAGCYAVHLVRTLAGAEPAVVCAHAKERSPGVDAAMSAEVSFDDGRTGQVRCSMQSLPRVNATVIGERATMKVTNPLAPQIWHRLTVKGSAGSRRERVAGGATYAYQLAAFVAAVRDGAPTHTPPADSIATMRVIDAIYRAAGMQPRTPTVVGA